MKKKWNSETDKSRIGDRVVIIVEELVIIGERIDIGCDKFLKLVHCGIEITKGEDCKA